LLDAVCGAGAAVCLAAALAEAQGLLSWFCCCFLLLMLRDGLVHEAACNLTGATASCTLVASSVVSIRHFVVFGNYY
jgi:hypothetical protein